MQRLLPILVLLGSFTLPSCSCKDEPADLNEEEVSEEEAYDHDHGQWLAMGVSSGGDPLAAYYDRTKGALRLAQASLASDGSISWKGVEVDGYAGDDGLDPGDIGVYASMEVASDGTIWMSYYNRSVGGLYYAQCSPDLVCETGLADAGSGASPDAGQWSSLALDGDDNPVIAHYDAYNQTLRVAHWNGSGFT